mmetsp:Transcript_98537/g.205498  ORF Transcript_98537/g.205498 Transcript_98537/m.205498 type:complete len:89 (-) Transcript_98537:1232-1498(-)
MRCHFGMCLFGLAEQCSTYQKVCPDQHPMMIDRATEESKHHKKWLWRLVRPKVASHIIRLARKARLIRVVKIVDRKNLDQEESEQRCS